MNELNELKEGYVEWQKPDIKSKYSMILFVWSSKTGLSSKFVIETG